MNRGSRISRIRVYINSSSRRSRMQGSINVEGVILGSRRCRILGFRTRGPRSFRIQGHMHRGRRRTRMHDFEEMEDRMIGENVGIRSWSAVHGISHSPPGEPLPLGVHPIDVTGRPTLTTQHFPRLFSSGDTCNLQRDRAILKDVLQRSAWIVKIYYARR